MSISSVVLSCNSDESVFEAAERLGFTSPDYRVGLVAHARPRENEVETVRIKASRNSRGFPVFRRLEKDSGETDATEKS